MSVGTSILTDAGLQALINAHAQGTKVKPKYYKVTDQNISLSSSLTDIPNAWMTADIDGYVQVDQNTVEFLIVIPTEAAHKYGRTFGLFLEDGTLLLVAKPPYPFPPGLRQTFKVQLYFEKANEVLDFQYIPFDETEQSLAVYDATTLHDVVAEMQDEINLLHQARIDYYSFKQTQGSKIGKRSEWADNAVNSYYAEVAENAKMVGGFPESALVKRSMKTITIYVNADRGSDTEGNGSQTKPFRTFNKALSLLPEFYKHNITIVLQKATNSYGNLNISGIIRKDTLSTLTITGEMVILRSGKVVSHSNAVDDPVYGSLVQVAKITTDKTFQPDQYKHKLLRVYKGGTSYYRIITNNDTDSIYCSYTFPVNFDGTWQWEILDWGTKCDSIYLYHCSGKIDINFLSIEGKSNTYQAVFKNTNHEVSVNYCQIKAYSSQTLPSILVNNANISLLSCFIDINNANTLVEHVTNSSSYVQNSGCVFLNCIRSAIYCNYDYSKIVVSNGTRIYKGTINPNYGIQMISGILMGSGSYGKNLVDAGASGGILLTRVANMQNSSNFAFGPGVITQIAGYIGLIDGGKLLVSEYLGVNIPNNDHLNLHSRLQVQGSVATQVTVVSANTTLGVGHHIVLVDASGGNRTITLPDATDCSGRQYIIKKIDSSTNTVTIAPQTGQTIDGQSSVVLSSQYQLVKIVSDGQKWFKIG